MNRSKIKVCGIKEINTIDCCLVNKIDFFGLIFYPKSPRNISLDKAIELVKYSKNKNISSVGVTVNETINNLNDLLIKLNLDYIQLHGQEDNDYISTIKNIHNIKLIKVISINKVEDLSKVKEYPNADIFLFDYKPNNYELPGGNAKKFDWLLIKNIKISKPWFLSGGINRNNIKDIKNYAIPYGIDISSGVEDKVGIKSNEKILSLMKTYESK